MSEIVHMLEAVSLHVEREDGWLTRVLAAIDARRFRLDSFVVHGPVTGAGTMEVTLIVRAGACTPEALLQSLQTVSGVRLARLLPPWRRRRGGKAQSTLADPIHVRRLERPRRTALAVGR